MTTRVQILIAFRYSFVAHSRHLLELRPLLANSFTPDGLPSGLLVITQHSFTLLRVRQLPY